MGDNPLTRFSNVFDINAKQEQVFGVIAQPIINSFLNGFNGTIFAYGQTGSGKTYTITGSPEDYNERGIIPRSIEQVFRFTSKSNEKCCVGISYMEIYNEVGYDLLDSKHQAYCFEQLPKIVLLEDSKGEIHMRNLSIHNVSCEKEAMRLLFLGDTNRTIAETPSNVISSRSHCIFTIYLSFWVGGTGKIRRSKLNLVDLAGSERIQKANVSGVTLMEAKSINLSLYYLEQVILALSEAKRSHVPYRNSIMTNILKDSLGGNCFTLMLATITISHYNFDETLSTCKFSQRVAMVSTDAYINEEFDPYQEISQLSREVETLRNHLKLQTCSQDANTALTDDEISKCKNIVNGLIESDEACCINIEPNMKLIVHCFNLLKNEICHLKANLKSQVERNEAICNYEDIIRCKDDEIKKLRILLANAVPTNSEAYCETPTSSPQSEEFRPITCTNEDTTPRRSKEEIRICKIQGDLHKKYDLAKSIVPLIEQCQRNIIMIRKRIDSHQLSDETTQDLWKELQHQQDIYRESLMQLQSIKAQVEHLEHGLQQAEFVMGNKLKKWVCESSSQLNGNDIPQIEDVRSKRSTSLGSECKSVTVSTNDVKEICLQTVEDAVVYYQPSCRPSTSCGYSKNRSKCLETKKPSRIDFGNIRERSKSAKCIRNDCQTQPFNNETNKCVDKPSSEICLATTNCCTNLDNATDIKKCNIQFREIPPPCAENVLKTKTCLKRSRVVLPPELENAVSRRESFKEYREIQPVALNSLTDTRTSFNEPCEVLRPTSASFTNRRSFRECCDIPPSDSSEELINTRRSIKKSREMPPVIVDDFTNTRRSLKEPTNQDSFYEERMSFRESQRISPPGSLENFVNPRKSFKQSRVEPSPEPENVRQSYARSRDIPPDTVNSLTNSRKSLIESNRLVEPLTTESFTNPRRSVVEPRRASSLSPDDLDQIRKSISKSREIPSSSDSLENVRKSSIQSKEISSTDIAVVDLPQENRSQESINRSPSNSIIDLRKSSKSLRINNDISDNEDTCNPHYSGQGIQSVEERQYQVNSVPCLNVMSGIASHSQSTFLSNKVGSFLDGCHLLRPRVPYFDVHVKIDPNKQTKTTTVHQKIVSINPESDDISGLLIPPSFFDKSLRKVSDTADHPLQKEKIPKLIKNLAGSLFHKLNKKTSENSGADGFLENEGASSGPKDEVLEDDEDGSITCSCEKLNETVRKKSSVVKFADDLNQDFDRTSAERPESNTDCPNNINETAETFSFFKDSDSKSFIEFIKTVPLTGDRDVDEEIINFYRTKFVCK